MSDTKCSVCKALVNSYSLDVTVDVPYIYHTYHYPEAEALAAQQVNTVSEKGSVD